MKNSKAKILPLVFAFLFCMVSMVAMAFAGASRSNFSSAFASVGTTESLLDTNRSNFVIDRILFVNSADKYLANYATAEAQEVTDNAIVSDSERQNGKKVFKTGTNTYDIVYVCGANGQNLGFRVLSKLSNLQGQLWLDNSHLFSGIIKSDYAKFDIYEECVCEGYGALTETEYEYDEEGNVTNSWENPVDCPNVGQVIHSEKIGYVDGIITHYERALETGGYSCPDCGTVSNVYETNVPVTSTFGSYTEKWSYGQKIVEKFDGLAPADFPHYAGVETALPINFAELILDGIDLSIFGNISSNSSTNLAGRAVNVNLSSISTAKSKFDNSNFSYMFSDLPCKKITINNISGLDSVQQKIGSFDMSHMFENCVNLQTVSFGNLFESITPKNISYMFAGCPSLQSVDLSSLDTSNVTDMSNMFATTSEQSHNMLNADWVKTFESRDAFVEYYVLDVLGYRSDFANLDEFKAWCLTIDPEANSTANIVIMMNINGNIVPAPVTNTEYVNYKMSTNFANMDEIVSAINANPEAFGLPARKTYVQFVNENMSTSFNNMQELVDVVNADPTGFGLPEKDGGYSQEDCEAIIQSNAGGETLYRDGENVYTAEEIELYIGNYMAKADNVTCISEQELANYFNHPIQSNMGTLVLGGTGSKFVINDGVNVENMFGESTFEQIVLPNQIGSGVSLSLPTKYTNQANGNEVDAIGSSNVGQTVIKGTQSTSNTGVEFELLALVLSFALTISALFAVGFVKNKAKSKN